MRLPTVLSAVVAVGLLSLLCDSQVNQRDTNAYGQLNWETLGAHSGNNVGLWLDLLLMREDPAVLNTPTFMKYFIALNNCANPAISQQIESEFDYPRLASYYSSHAADLLSRVPNTITVKYGGDFAGTYDFATKSFPIVDSVGKNVTFGITHFVVDSGSNPSRNSQCNALRSLKGRGSPGDPDPIFTMYNLVFDKSFSFTSIPMDESSAKNWVQRTYGTKRNFSLVVDIEIPEQKPKVGKNPRDPLSLAAEFTAHVKKIVAVDETQHPLAVLYQP